MPAAAAYLLLAQAPQPKLQSASASAGGGGYCGPLSRQCPDAFVKPDAPPPTPCGNLAFPPSSALPVAMEEIAALAGPWGSDLEGLRQLAAESNGIYASDSAMPIYAAVLLAAAIVAAAIPFLHRAALRHARQLRAVEAQRAWLQGTPNDSAVAMHSPLEGPVEKAILVEGAALSSFRRLAEGLLGIYIYDTFQSIY